MGTKHNLRIFAAVAAAGLALTACGSTGSSNSSASGSSDCVSGQTLAFLGATTGPNGALGQNMVGGIKLALDDYNKAHSDCTVGFKAFDSQGDPDQATTLATQIVGDQSIIGLVGPGFSGESLSTGKTFSAAGLPSISPSATNVTITQQGWPTWHRVIGNDSAQGAAVATYLKDTANAKKVFVVADDSDYGKGLAGYVKSGLGGLVAGTDSVATGQTDFSATVTAIKASGADAMFYGGYYAEAGLLAKQLRQAGYTGLFMSGDGSEDAQFVKIAGADAANGAILTAPAGPAPADFDAKYQALIGSPSGLYSTQSFDATNIFLAGIDAGKTSHADLNDFVGAYTGTGISGPIAFDQNGDIKQTAIFAYKVANGKLDTQNPTPIK